MEKIKFGIIGCGRIAHRHAKHSAKNGSLIAVCDILPEKAKTLALENNALPYYSIEALLADQKKSIDVIAICTPNGLHAAHAIQALKAGFNVLCEKPLGINVQECGAMIQAAEKANKRLFVVKQNRFNPPVIAVKKAIDEGKLGKILSIQLSCFWNRNNEYYTGDWQGSSDLDGGTLYTQFSHFIDLLYWMFGDVKEVYGFCKNSMHQGIIDFEDSGVVAMEFYNGIIGTINFTINSFQKNMEGSLTVFGEKGTVKIGGQYLNELEYQNIQDFEITNLPPGNIANNYGSYQGSMSNHDKVYENLIDVLQNNASISTSAFEGLKTVELIDKIYDKIRNGKLINA